MTDRAEVVVLLQKTAIFSGMAIQTLENIAGITRRLSFDEGDAIYQFGDDARDVFIVVSGRVRFSLGVGNRAGSGSIMSEGHLIGWAALVEDQPRRLATATCLEPSTMLAINGRKLLEIFEGDTAAGYTAMRRLAAMIARNLTETLTS
jgi:CRP-like cAMP-binding protein